MPFAQTDAGPLHFVVTGEGPDLVLVHELGGSAASFDGLIAQLGHSHRILRYDQSGCGHSPPATAALSIPDQARQLGQVMVAAGLGGDCRLVGVAAGAAIAVSLALAQPERVSALALCAPALAVPGERQVYLEERSRQALDGGMAAVVEATLARSYPPVLRADAGRFARYRERFLATDPASYAEANRALAQVRLETHLHELAMPSLFLAGRHDLMRPPSEIEVMAARLRRARFAVIESGHLMPVQAPEEMARQLLAFLADPAETARPGADAHA